jgi:hypothetical protein
VFTKSESRLTKQLFILYFIHYNHERLPLYTSSPYTPTILPSFLFTYITLILRLIKTHSSQELTINPFIESSKIDTTKEFILVENLYSSLIGLRNTFYYNSPYYTLLYELSRVLNKVNKVNSLSLNCKRKLELKGLKVISGKVLILTLL